ncbi:MAG: HD domain-containing protein, partial [Thermoanaerobaculia bacterium]|nr:HD domain-containing protein [Thermoanaerobaculia bacterium]
MEIDPKLEARFKVVLYRCLEEVHATKAALYLLGGGLYRVTTSYGFREGLPATVDPKDEMVDRLRVKRKPYAVNGLAEDSAFSERLYDADTSKILVAPIYSRGKLAGLIDMRDKSADRDFEARDLRQAMEIADQFLEVFSEEGLYGQRKISLGEVPVTQRVVHAGASSATQSVVEKAEEEIARGVLFERPLKSTDSLEKKVEAATRVLPAFLGLQSIAVAAISAFSETAGFQRIVATGEVPEDSLGRFRDLLQDWFEGMGDELPYLESEIEYPFGAREDDVNPDRIDTLLGVVVRAAEPQTMILSAVFDREPDDETRDHFASLHGMLEEVIREAAASSRLDSVMEKAAMKLLEPDLEGYPDLVLHSRRVAGLAADLARTIGLSEPEIETIRLAGLVHDVGLRPIGYQRVQRKGELSEEEMEVVRKHPVVGGAIVASSVLGPE